MKMRFLGGEQVNFFHDEKNKKSQKKLRLGAQSSYVVKYFEGSNAGKTTTMHN